MTDPFSEPTLPSLLVQTHGRLQPDGPTRFATLATRATDGGASARMVVIRAFDAVAMSLTVHTNSLSAKCAEIAADPKGELVVWDPGSRLQVRARVTLTARRGSQEEWQTLAPPERMTYTATPLPAHPIGSPFVPPEPDPAVFSVLTARIEELDVLRLGRTHHIRAVFNRADGFTGAWVGP